MKRQNFIGVDPGASGGLAIRYCAGIEGGIDSWKVLPLPKATEGDVRDWIQENVLGEPAPFFGVIERVWSSPQQGVASAFTFGRSYGMLRGILIGANIPFDEVLPQKWQKAMGCLTKGNKNVSKQKAQQLFPGIKITHAIADAMLLAEYARRTYSFEKVLTGEAP